MIFLFTDFGVAGPYAGQMKSVVACEAPGVPVIDLMHDAPAFAPRPSAYLLAALSAYLPQSAVVCAVVDPGVGSSRPPVALEAEGRRFVGPGNGLFEIVSRRAGGTRPQCLSVDGAVLSASFHGRDLFAPAAARWMRDGTVAVTQETPESPAVDWPDDLAEVIYVDGYGNAMTGLRAPALSGRDLYVANQRIVCAQTFSDRPTGALFWYENSIGLAEIAANRDNAARLLGLTIGSQVMA